MERKVITIESGQEVIIRCNCGGGAAAANTANEVAPLQPWETGSVEDFNHIVNGDLNSVGKIMNGKLRQLIREIQSPFLKKWSKEKKYDELRKAIFNIYKKAGYLPPAPPNILPTVKITSVRYYDPSFENNRENFHGGKNTKTRKASKKQEGGAKAKKGPNGFMRFSKEMRGKLAAEDAALKSDVVAMSRRIGEMWRGLSDAEKKRYSQ